MPDKSINRFLVRRYRKTRVAASAIEPRFYAETVHQFRAEVKKLRAVMRFLRNDTDYRLPRPLRKFYKRAGAVRDYQVQLQAVVAQNDFKLPSFCIWLGFRMAEAGRYWRHRKLDFALKTLKTELRREPLVEINEVYFNTWKVAFITWLRKIAAGNNLEDCMHEIRKRAKDMLHVAAFYRSTIAGDNAESRLEQQLRQLTDTAGKHHDDTRLLQSAQCFSAEYRHELSEKENAALLSAIQNREKERRECAADLQRMIGALLQPGTEPALPVQDALPH